MALLDTSLDAKHLALVGQLTLAICCARMVSAINHARDM
jgi:hypothetical protein